jgi:hypothetical protein
MIQIVSIVLRIIQIKKIIDFSNKGILFHLKTVAFYPNSMMLKFHSISLRKQTNTKNKDEIIILIRII